MSNPEVEARNAQYLKAAQDQIDAPIRPVVPVYGMCALSKGSWTLLVEEGPYYSIHSNDVSVGYGPIILKLVDVWDMPDGVSQISGIADYGTKGVRSFIRRERNLA